MTIERKIELLDNCLNMYYHALNEIEKGTKFYLLHEISVGFSMALVTVEQQAMTGKSGIHAIEYFLGDVYTKNKPDNIPWTTQGIVDRIDLINKMKEELTTS